MVQKGRIPNRLKKYRCMFGFTQTEVAKKLGMKQSNLISEWEKGVTAPGLDNLLKLANLYRTLIEEIYFERWLKHRSLIIPISEQVRIINHIQKRNFKNHKRNRTR